jgi:uncharacterized protein (DUF885 family)
MRIGIFALAFFSMMRIASAADPVESLHKLFKEEWEYTMEQAPAWASQLGDRRWNDQWGDASLEAVEKRNEHARTLLIKLKEFDRTALPPPEQLNYDLFRRRCELDVEEAPYRWELVPLTQRDGIQTADELADALRFETRKDYEDWIGRCNALGKLIDQTIALMREGIRERIVQPKATMQRVPAQIEKQIVAKPELSPFFKPFQKLPEAIPTADRAALMANARRAIETVVIPGYHRFHEFFTKEYLPACFDEVGVWQVPKGKDLYAFLARRFTTTDMTPRQIHDLGLAEVKRIRAEMEAVMKTTGFKGALPEFFEHLRTDPKFFFKTGDELLAAYRALTREIDPRLVRLFRTLPRTPYGVEPIPDKIAPDTTTAYYREPAADGSRAGTFFANLYKPETRPKWEMMALALHEAVPGHHLQIALAMEQGTLPEFRRHMHMTAYVEGWGLYAESLGDELELYKDPYSKFGKLTYEMWRAIRLVVDTGIHDMHWTRQQAIDFFKANAAKTDQDIVNEVDRYISWPGQALAYKIGELKIKELRARAARELGEKFDVREFHDVVLLSGALPLDLLTQRIDNWIAEKKKR